MQWWRRWGVVVVAWLAVMAGAVAFFDRLLDQQTLPNRADDLHGQVLELRRARDGHFRLEGSINGHRVRMLIDTGATGIGIDATLARRIGLPESGVPLELATANGVVHGYEVQLDEVRLGDIALHGLTANISPRFGDPDEVLLGMNALKQLTLTMQDDTLRLSAPTS